MIRPVGMGKVNFKGYTIIGGDDPKPKENEQEKPKTRGLTKSEKNIVMAGARLGAIMGVGGTHLYNNIQTKDMIEDMKMELDACHDQDIVIKDVTGDEIPDIVFEDMYGDAVYYDFMKHDVSLRIGDEKVKKMY